MFSKCEILHFLIFIPIIMPMLSRSIGLSQHHQSPQKVQKMHTGLDTYTTCNTILTAHSSQLTAHSSQLTAHSSQLTAHSSQLVRQIFIFLCIQLFFLIGKRKEALSCSAFSCCTADIINNSQLSIFFTLYCQFWLTVRSKIVRIGE